MARSWGILPVSDMICAQQFPRHPFHHNVGIVPALVGNHLHDAGVIELFADLLLALEALEEDGVALHLGVGNLDGHGLSGAQVGALEDRGHAAAGDQAVDLEVVELFASVDRDHGWRLVSR